MSTNRATELAKSVHYEQIIPTLDEMIILIIRYNELQSASMPNSYIRQFDGEDIDIREVASLVLEYSGGWSVRDL